MKLRTITFLLLSATLLTACSPKTEKVTPFVVNDQPVGIIAEGRLFPARAIEQAFTLSGVVKEVLVKDGSVVSQGQAIASLEQSPEANATLQQAKLGVLSAQQALDDLRTNSTINLAKSELAYLDAIDERKKATDRIDLSDTDRNRVRLQIAEAALKLAEVTFTTLKDGAGVDPELLSSAQARLTAAIAAEISAQSLVDSQILTANMAGTVVDLSLLPGQQVSAGVPVLAIADYSGWLVKTDNLTELEISQISPGDEVTVSLDAIPGSTFAGVVSSINQRYEEKRGDITYTVTVELSQNDPKMMWGMTAAIYFKP